MMDELSPRHETSARRHVLVDATLLETAMRLTGRGQADTLDEALAHLAELAALETAASAELPAQSVAGC